MTVGDRTRSPGSEFQTGTTRWDRKWERTLILKSGTDIFKGWPRRFLLGLKVKKFIYHIIAYKTRSANNSSVFKTLQIGEWESTVVLYVYTWGYNTHFECIHNFRFYSFELLSFETTNLPKGISPTENAQGGWIPNIWIFAFPSEFFENIPYGYVFGVKESNGDNNKILSLLHDLENQFQTPFCMTFHISSCKRDTMLISVSILTFSMSRISKMLKTITWPWRLTLELKITHIHCMTFISSGCIHDADLTLVSILTLSRSRIS